MNFVPFLVLPLAAGYAFTTIMTPEDLNKWRIVPRLMVLAYGILVAQVASWFMGLPDPNAAQAAFVSTVSLASAGVFNFYVK